MKNCASLFICHASKDKPFVNQLAADLMESGVMVWVDDAEIKIGDSLIGKIAEGIDSMDYLGVVLSPNSVSSEWVTKEVEMAMNREIHRKQVKVLPLLYKKCSVPGFLLGKLYVDFTKKSEYLSSLTKLLQTLAYKNVSDFSHYSQRVVIEWDTSSPSNHYVKASDPYYHLITSREIQKQLVFNHYGIVTFKSGASSGTLKEPALIYGHWFEEGDSVVFDKDGRIIRIHAYRGECSY